MIRQTVGWCWISGVKPGNDGTNSFNSWSRDLATAQRGDDAILLEHNIVDVDVELLSNASHQRKEREEEEGDACKDSEKDWQLGM